MPRRHERLRLYLSDWRPWTTVAYLGLVGVVVALYFHQTEIGKQEATREAERQARVAQCVGAIPQLRKTQRFLEGVREFHRVAAMNSKATLDATPKTDPQYQVRLQNYRRIAATVADVSGLSFHIPTVGECQRLGNNP